jgi:hypothetical protein
MEPKVFMLLSCGFAMTLLCAFASNCQENTMPQSSHDRTAELHNLAEHAHAAASAAHTKGDHLTGHELSKKALEHSMNAHRQSEEMVKKAKISSKA